MFSNDICNDYIWVIQSNQLYICVCVLIYFSILSLDWFVRCFFTGNHHLSWKQNMVSCRCSLKPIQ